MPPLLKVSNFLEAVVEWGMDKELAVVVVADGSESDDESHLQEMNAVSGLRY